MKNFLRLIVLSSLISCNSSVDIKPVDVVAPSGQAVETPIEKPIEVSVPTTEVMGEEPNHGPVKPIGPEYPVADVKKIFTVKIVDLNYTVEQRKKLEQAEKLIAKIMNSEKYEKAVLSRKFTSTKLSSKSVYEKLFTGAESLLPAVNYQMDLKVSMYYKFNRVVGYTYPSDMVVYTNSKFHKYFDACKVASNLVHEWTHKMGFGHASASDGLSVPYSHNDIIEDLCQSFL